MLRRSFLEDVVDIHVHAGSSVADRKVDAYEVLRQTEEAEYVGFLVKDHYVLSAHGCLMLEEHFNGGCRVSSPIVMNNSVGAFNASVLDCAYNMGAKIAYMPTVSPRMRINKHKEKTPHGSGGITVEEKPIYYLDGDGKLVPEVVEVLNYMAAHPDFILAIGHGTLEETNVPLEVAFRLGMKRILVNHPHSSVSASVERVVCWAGWGVNIEIITMEHSMTLEDRDDLPNPIDLTKQIMDSGVLKERIVIGSDFGQAVSPYPVEGLYKYLNLFHDTVGISEADLAVMVKENPARLMGMLDWGVFLNLREWGLGKTKKVVDQIAEVAIKIHRTGKGKTKQCRIKATA